MSKVLLVNGSPHAHGCTYTALDEIRMVLEQEGIEAEIFQIGTKPVRGCIACDRCTEEGCIFTDDVCRELTAAMKAADGVIIGSPVYYAGPNGALTALLDRVFYACGRSMAYKPAAAIVSCRRGGASAAFDRLNKYFTINQMPVVSSQYWNSVHGFTPEDVQRDLEGLQTMRTLGRNMAWMLKSLAAADLPKPQQEPRLRTNFID